MTVAVWVLVGLFLFYLLAPLPYLITDRVRHGTWGRRPFYGWRVWPFHEGFSYRLCAGRRCWRHYFEFLGPWYRSTFRWWWATWHCWRHPAACHFCPRRALGVYSCEHAPLSLAVCAGHFGVLRLAPEELVALLRGDKEWPG